MAKYIINEFHINGTTIYKVRHDINGNPRYIVHYSYINKSYKKALQAARDFGFTKCSKKEYNDYLIITSCRGFNGVYLLIQDAMMKS